MTVKLYGYTLVVTGFPRSGTSAMMRMLEHGGVRILADSKLKLPQHKHDPYGCNELENVGTVIRSNKKGWTRNKAVKIVTPYASWFPIDRKLKAVFMQRDINEIITSLIAMKSIWEEDIAESISWARGYLKHNNVPILPVNYHDMVKYPKTTAIQIQDFLGVELNIEAMAKSVDSDARNKYKKDSSILGHDMPDKLLRMDTEAYTDLNVEVYLPCGSLNEKDLQQHIHP